MRRKRLTFAQWQSCRYEIMASFGFLAEWSARMQLSGWIQHH